MPLIFEQIFSVKCCFEKQVYIPTKCPSVVHTLTVQSVDAVSNTSNSSTSSMLQIKSMIREILYVKRWRGDCDEKHHTDIKCYKLFYENSARYWL